MAPPGPVSDRRLLATVDFPRTEELAERLGRWTTLVEALENEALQLLDDEAERALPLLDRAAEVASVRRLTEDLVWIDYIRGRRRLQRALGGGSRRGPSRRRSTAPTPTTA